MKLHYRGISYDRNPSTLEIDISGVAGKFRGQKWTSRNRAQVPSTKSDSHLVYRGVVVK